jgi:uncharacterized membrane protein HdeD (DUF308 family)
VVGIWLVVIGVFEIVASFGVRKASTKLAAPFTPPITAP